MITFEWALQYQEKARRVLLLLGKIVGDDVLEAGHAFAYGKVRKIDYQDEDSSNLVGYIETSKGERIILVSEYKLILASCVPLELQKRINTSNNLIVALQPFTVGQASFTDSLEVSTEDNGIEEEDT